MKTKDIKDIFIFFFKSVEILFLCHKARNLGCPKVIYIGNNNLDEKLEISRHETEKDNNSIIQYFL